jgi:AcrR family transcriptional regulator
MNTVATDGPKTWQQTKSEMTRTAILDAAVACFHDLGYAGTTTENVARRAGVSRGAMLHHFPTRFDLIKAAVEHLYQQRLAMFAEAEWTIQRGAEHSRIEEGIDAYWRLLGTPIFIVFRELKVAARTDKELDGILAQTLADFSKVWSEAVRRIFPDLALSEAYVRTSYLTQYMLDGMAAARTEGGPPVPEQMMLDWLKRELRRSYQDVLTTVTRRD